MLLCFTALLEEFYAVKWWYMSTMGCEVAARCAAQCLVNTIHRLVATQFS